MATASTEFSSSGRQKIRVFLEGREVPAVSAMIHSQPDQPSVASIELVPLSIIKFIRPRTQVHVFVRDSFNFGDNDYYLAFEGEVMGRTMVKRHDGRAFKITAFDYSNYWDDTKAYVMNPNFLVSKVADGVSLGDPIPSTIAKAEAGVVMQTSATVNTVMAQMLQVKDSQGNLDLVRGIVNVIYQLAFANEFYRAAYERLRITDRLIAYPSGNLGKFLEGLKVDEFLQTFTGMQGGLYSLRQMLMNIMTLVFHNAISVPFPSFLQVTSGERKGKTIGQFLFVPDAYTLPPPKCNVIFPNQQISFTFDDDFRAAPTRYGFKASFPLFAGNETSFKYFPTMYYPPSFSDYMMGAKDSKTRTATASDIASGLGPSSIIKSKDGRSYANVFYGQPAKDSGVNTTIGTALRESDYLSNEESLKGIYFMEDALLPGYSALIRTGNSPTDANGRPTDQVGTSPEARNKFLKEVGKFLFYKKRYSSRNVQSSIMFNPYLVPGMNCLLLDDSEAGQSFIAKLQSVTHNMTHEGFNTSIELSLGRDFDEIDFLTGGIGEPPLPPWFDANVFGQNDAEGKALFDKETKYLSSKSEGAIGKDETAYRNTYVKEPTVYPNLSKFYQLILGCDSVTLVQPPPPASSKSKLPQRVLVTTRGAVQDILSDYKNKLSGKGGSEDSRDKYVRQFIKRPVTRMIESFRFLGAQQIKAPTSTSGGGKMPEEFATFTAIIDSKITPLPGRFDGTGYSDEMAIKIRRNVIDAYVQLLQDRRGFRG